MSEGLNHHINMWLLRESGINKLFELSIALLVMMVGMASCQTVNEVKRVQEWLPSEFNISDWGGFTGYQIVFERGEFVYRMLNDGKVEAQKLKCPGKDQWEQFWKTLNDIDVWNWNQSYAIDQREVIVDGGGRWRVDIQYGKQAIESTGKNAYPDPLDSRRLNQSSERSKPFLKLEDAIEHLFGIENLYGE